MRYVQLEIYPSIMPPPISMTIVSLPSSLFTFLSSPLSLLYQIYSMYIKMKKLRIHVVLCHRAMKPTKLLTFSSLAFLSFSASSKASFSAWNYEHIELTTHHSNITTVLLFFSLLPRRRFSFSHLDNSSLNQI